MSRAIANKITRSDDSRQGDAAAGFTARLKAELGSRSPAWLAREAQLPDASVRKYLAGSQPTIIPAIAIADALGVSLEWLLSGSGEKTRAHSKPVPGANLFDATSEDWVFVPRYRFDVSLAAVSQYVVETFPMRRAWLNKAVGTTKGIWITEMPAGMSSVADAGDTILCMNDYQLDVGRVYIIVLDGQVTVRRVVGSDLGGLALRADGPPVVDTMLSDLSPGSFSMVGRVIAKIELSPIPVHYR